jgi:GH24 family phage-related lysozyme (muramidase)
MRGVKTRMMVNPSFETFLDGFTGGGLFTKLRQPGAVGQFGAWVYGGGAKLAGLVTRRERERVMFVG